MQWLFIIVITSYSIHYTKLYEWDIEVSHDGVVCIGPGSGQWSIAATYDADSGSLLSTVNFVRQRSYLDFNYQYNKLYSITTDGSPRDITAYEIVDGIFTNVYDSPYHGDYEMSIYINISPDGQYIFNGYGNIFTCASTQDGDMIYDGNIDGFTSVCFDLTNNAFYTVNENELISYA